MGGATDDNGNGRITLAVLGQKIDALTDTVKTLAGKMDTVCEKTAVHGTEISTLKDEVGRLRTKSDTWNMGNSILGAAASLLALFK